MKKIILIMFLAMSLSFNSASKNVPIKHVKVSDKLEIYRLRDNHNVLEFDKKIKQIILNNQ